MNTPGKADPPSTPRSGLHEGMGNGARFLFILACLVIVLAGLRAARDVVVPVLFAGFLALICIRPVRLLQRLGAPKVMAIIVIVLMVLGSLVGFATVLGSSVKEFADKSQTDYKDRLGAVTDDAVLWLNDRGVNVSRDDLAGTLDSGAVLKLVSQTTKGLLELVSDLAVIILVMVFMLVEAEGLSGKLRRALGTSDEEIREVSQVSDLVYRFLSIKTVLNLFVAGLVVAWTAILDIDFPLLWGLVAFVFNFVPNIGSVIAAIPPALLALIQVGFGHALLTAGGFVAINTVIGNIIEPRVMGRRLGLSPLVVIVSLFFWNWVLGPVGMLLSVPLTMVVKVVLENSEDLRPIGVLLGPTHITDDPTGPGPPQTL